MLPTALSPLMSKTASYLISGDGAFHLTMTLFVMCMALVFYAPHDPMSVSSSPSLAPPRQSPCSSIIPTAKPPSTSSYFTNTTQGPSSPLRPCLARQPVDHFIDVGHGLHLKVTQLGPSSSRANLVTLHELGTSPDSCFATLLTPDALSLPPLSNLCVLHITLPGQQTETEGDDTINALTSSTTSPWTLEDLIPMLEVVRSTLHLETFIGFGVGLGSHVWLRYSTIHPQRIAGLMLVSANRHSSTIYETMTYRALHYGLSGNNTSAKLSSRARQAFSHLFFSAPFLMETPASQIATYLQTLDQRPRRSLQTLLTATMNRVAIRQDALVRIRHIPMLLIAAGYNPQAFPFLEFPDDETHTLELLRLFDPRTASYLKIAQSGRLVTVEQPSQLLTPLKLFLSGFGY